MAAAVEHSLLGAAAAAEKVNGEEEEAGGEAAAVASSEVDAVVDAAEAVGESGAVVSIEAVAAAMRVIGVPSMCQLEATTIAQLTGITIPLRNSSGDVAALLPMALVAGVSAQQLKDAGAEIAKVRVLPSLVSSFRFTVDGPERCVKALIGDADKGMTEAWLDPVNGSRTARNETEAADMSAYLSKHGYLRGARRDGRAVGADPRRRSRWPASGHRTGATAAGHSAYTTLAPKPGDGRQLQAALDPGRQRTSSRRACERCGAAAWASTRAGGTVDVVARISDAPRAMVNKSASMPQQASLLAPALGRRR
jgi:hypothetical protein